MINNERILDYTAVKASLELLIHFVSGSLAIVGEEIKPNKTNTH